VDIASSWAARTCHLWIVLVVGLIGTSVVDSASKLGPTLFRAIV
jgi:hypothetical protein